MLRGVRLAREFFAMLVGIDLALVRVVADGGCPRCGGPLHRGDHGRKPRGALVASAGEAFNTRFNLCCGHCLKRCLPPSVRFQGRRVYLGAVVFLACVWALAAGDLDEAGVPRVTVRRWLAWWSTALPTTSLWQELRAGFVPPPPDEATLPLSLCTRLRQWLGPLSTAALAKKIVERVARMLAPLTTDSCPNSSRFPRLV
jgi:hypothetical protein